jgi:hypothetical protein
VVPSAPPAQTIGGPRNTVNIEQSAFPFSTSPTIDVFDNYWLKNRRSVERG